MERRHPDFEASIRANPDDVSTYLAYADWLLSEGEPRGALIRLHHQFLQKPSLKQRKELFRQQDELLHAYPHLDVRPLSGSVIAVNWWMGFVQGVRPIGLDFLTRPEVPSTLQRVLLAPSCRFVRSMQFVSRHSEATYDPLIHALRDIELPPTVRSMQIAYRPDSVDWYNAHFWGSDRWIDGRVHLQNEKMAQLSDLTCLSERMPELNHLLVRAPNLPLSTYSFPQLRVLSLEESLVRPEHLEALASRQHPELTSLSILLVPWDDKGRVHVRDLRPLLSGENFPRLRDLKLVIPRPVSGLVQALVEAPLTPQLSTLSVRGGFEGHDVPYLVRHADAFRHLQKVLWQPDNQSQIRPADLERLLVLFPGAGFESLNRDREWGRT